MNNSDLYILSFWIGKLYEFLFGIPPVIKDSLLQRKNRSGSRPRPELEGLKERSQEAKKEDKDEEPMKIGGPLKVAALS